MEAAMTLEQIAGRAQDGLLDIMQTVKVMKEEIVRLNKQVIGLQQQLEETDITVDIADE